MLEEMRPCDWNFDVQDKFFEKTSFRGYRNVTLD